MLQPMAHTPSDVPLIDAFDTEAAFAHRGAQAAVVRPRFGPTT